MINKNFILGLIIGIVLSGGIVYAATSIASSNVTYTGNSQSTVEGALNDLYTKSRYGDAGAGDIRSGKKAVVNGSYVTGTLTVPSYTSLSGTQGVSAGSTSPTLNGYYNMSNYNIACGVGGVDLSKVEEFNSTSTSWSKSYSITSSMKSVVVLTISISDYSVKAPSITACPTSMTCSSTKIGVGGVSGGFAKNSYLHTIDNPTGASGTLTIKMQHTTSGSDNHGKHEFIVLSK